MASGVLELTFTASELSSFAAESGYIGSPFCWNDARRFLLKWEPDAMCFRKYDLARNEVEHVLGSFPVFQPRDEQQRGEYRTKRVILEIYDAMVEAECTGVPYQTRLDPPPADPRVSHARQSEVR